MVNEALDDERWPAEARLAIRILRDRVSELEDAIGLTLIKPHRYFPDLGLDPICEKILGILIRRPSVSRDVIFMTLWGDKAEDDQPQAKTIDVHLVQIRAALDEINIPLITRRGMGWLLQERDRKTLLAMALKDPIEDNRRLVTGNG